MKNGNQNPNFAVAKEYKTDWSTTMNITVVTVTSTIFFSFSIDTSNLNLAKTGGENTIWKIRNVDSSCFLAILQSTLRRRPLLLLFLILHCCVRKQVDSRFAKKQEESTFRIFHIVFSPPVLAKFRLDVSMEKEKNIVLVTVTTVMFIVVLQSVLYSLATAKFGFQFLLFMDCGAFSSFYVY
jgi:hypothetical protein